MRIRSPKSRQQGWRMDALAPFVVLALATAIGVFGAPTVGVAQDMIQFLDLKSDEFTKADTTRAEIEALIAAQKPGEPLDLSARRLNHLDLSGLDLTGVNLQSARINGANFKGSRLDRAILDQAWALDADFTGASFKEASLFSTQLLGARLDGADFTAARVAGDFSRASLKGARFDRADLSADMRNQSMGLMRGVFRSSDLRDASFRNANLARVVLEYADLRGADLREANLRGSELGGANLSGAKVADADFDHADVNSARLISLEGRNAARNLESAVNLERAFTDAPRPAPATGER